jgi:hypothetical protein
MSLSHHPSIVKNGLVAYFDAANPKSYPAGQDPYVSGVNLLFDGESLVDKSAKTQSFTNNGSVAVSTTQKKFGNSSLYFSGRTADGGSNSYLSFAANSDFGFGSGNWTVETWFYKTTPLASLDVLFDNRVGLGGAGGYVSGVALYVQAGVVKTGNDAERLAGATIATGVWNHLMISRSGNNIYLGVNGTVVSAAFSTTLHSAPQLYVGNSVVSEYAGGYMDDYRVTKGFARYTTNYTVPTGPNALTGAVTDLTKNKINATLTRSPIYSSFGQGSFLLNETASSAIIFSDSALYSLAENFTTDLWFRGSTTQVWFGIHYLLDMRTSHAGSEKHFSVNVTAQQLKYYTNTGEILASSRTMLPNIWYNMIITKNNNNLISLYFNGVFESSYTHSVAFDSTTKLRIGHINNVATPDMYVASFKYYNRVLSGSEVLQNYNATKSRYGY